MGSTIALVQEIGTGATVALAAATVWLANQTRRSSTAAEKAQGFTAAAERSRLLIELLNMFEEKVLRVDTRRLNVLLTPAKSICPLLRKRKPDVAATQYTGPTGVGFSDDPFDHPLFVLRPATLSRINEMSEDTARDVLNGLEQFASALLASEAGKVWDATTRDLLLQPTRNSCIEAIDQYYDVLCYYRAVSPTLYTAIRLLYTQWEPATSALAFESLLNLHQPTHNMVRQFHHYRVGSDSDFQEFAPNPPQSFESRVPYGEYPLESEGPDPLHLWIQAVDTADRPINGYPVALQFPEYVDAQIRTGERIATAFLHNHQTAFDIDPRDASLMVVRGNSTGTVVVKVTSQEHGTFRSSSTVTIVNPLSGMGPEAAT